MTRVTLASGSPRRRELLAELLDSFAVVPSQTDEDVEAATPAATALVLAVMKALAVAAGDPDAVVVGSDTVVHDGHRYFAKPAGPEEAAAMLRSLAGREHTVVTGVAVVSGGWLAGTTAQATVTMASMSDAAIARYVASGRPLDKAGAYAIQDDDVPTVAWLDGCYCGVMGLPLWETWDLLRPLVAGLHQPGTNLVRCRTCPARARVQQRLPSVESRQ